MRYELEILDPMDDDGQIVSNVGYLQNEVIGHVIVSAGREKVNVNRWRTTYEQEAFVITLDNGKRVVLVDTNDCCAYTELESFLLNPELVSHVITGVGTTDGYSTWHIYADMGDVLQLNVGWSSGNPFYYGYGFDIQVQEIDNGKDS